MKNNKDINELSFAQKQRLAYIDFCLAYFGRVGRIELSEHFNIGVTSCSRDFAKYKKLAKDNLVLDQPSKQYVITDAFEPIFEHDIGAVLSNLVNGFGDGISEQGSMNEYCFEAVSLVHPDSNIVASTMRAILDNACLKITYHSLTEGKSERVIVPHSIVNTGYRWIIRAFDMVSMEFRDFVCARIETSIRERLKPSLDKLIGLDHKWNNLIKLDLVPHPDITESVAIELEYSMTRGHKIVEIRESLVDYFLKYWNVDCSGKGKTKVSNTHLLLNNRELLKGIK